MITCDDFFKADAWTNARTDDLAKIDYGTTHITHKGEEQVQVWSPEKDSSSLDLNIRSMMRLRELTEIRDAYFLIERGGVRLQEYRSLLIRHGDNEMKRRGFFRLGKLCIARLQMIREHCYGSMDQYDWNHHRDHDQQSKEEGKQVPPGPWWRMHDFINFFQDCLNPLYESEKDQLTWEFATELAKLSTGDDRAVLDKYIKKFVDGGIYRLRPLLKRPLSDHIADTRRSEKQRLKEQAESASR